MTYQSEVLADAPLAFWRLGEASGTTMVDSSSNARDGAYMGSPTLGAAGLLVGDSNTAVSFDGSDDRGNMPDAAWLDTASFTIEALIKPTGVSGTQTVAGRFDSWGSGSFVASSFVLRLGGNKARLYIFAGNSEWFIEGTTTLTAGSTYHLAGTYDGGTGAATLYVDGVSVASGTQTGMNNSTLPLSIGSTSGGSFERFAGTIDEVAYYGAALSASRIAAHHTAAITAPPPGVDPTLDATLPAIQASLTLTIHTESVTDNNVNGRDRAGGFIDESTEPIAPLPPGVALAAKVDKVLVYPTPTLVDGRPT